MGLQKNLLLRLGHCFLDFFCRHLNSHQEVVVIPLMRTRKFPLATIQLERVGNMELLDITRKACYAWLCMAHASFSLMRQRWGSNRTCAGGLVHPKSGPGPDPDPDSHINPGPGRNLQEVQIPASTGGHFVSISNEHPSEMHRAARIDQLDLSCHKSRVQVRDLFTKTASGHLKVFDTCAQRTEDHGFCMEHVGYLGDSIIRSSPSSSSSLNRRLEQPPKQFVSRRVAGSIQIFAFSTMHQVDCEAALSRYRRC